MTTRHATNPLSVDLPDLYSRSRCLKPEVYRAWIDNLSRMAMTGCPMQQQEALRRIDYIENHLLKGQAA